MPATEDAPIEATLIERKKPWYETPAFNRAAFVVVLLIVGGVSNSMLPETEDLATRELRLIKSTVSLVAFIWIVRYIRKG